MKAVQKANEILKFIGKPKPDFGMNDVIEATQKKWGIKISVYETDFSGTKFDKNVSGVAIKNELGQFEIYINKSHISVRKRFTLAHELGHITLGHITEKNMSVDTFKFRHDGKYTENEKDEEKEANMFAASLLMPADYVVEMEAKISNIADLAKYFGVSETAMQNRLYHLGILDC